MRCCVRVLAGGLAEVRERAWLDVHLHVLGTRKNTVSTQAEVGQRGERNARNSDKKIGAKKYLPPNHCGSRSSSCTLLLEKPCSYLGGVD